ncbi:GNAT family N-acetyltransferase [Croceimicrobium hydrocarbonivorans]|uniref:GNAT family N-acetyltransferase n=1 Tax=Croceimicrobium hydrocarbonivorans TaxID=2761580 RepID=A0A7H0VG63_9FLAO|nr:GNAT family N-acetyltransferase [Croceimicrobium hydrocarbonivorans]QNR24711.1 GNAT family N-acetyltransferase [Croceimicrobium hydrocarbonivorans]
MKSRLALAKMEDLPAMKSLFEASIRQTCNQDYSPEEIEAWLLSLKNKQRWEELIQNQIVWLALVEADLAGFCSLKDGHYLDFLYVLPDHQGLGIAKQLVAAAIDETRKLGNTKISSDISITARPFMEAQGWKVIRMNENPRADQTLINYRMELEL